jgi:NRPS condensation-like uncharacterized protein
MAIKKQNLHIFTERTHLWNPAVTILMKLSVDGIFVEERFEQALQTLKNIHPLLYSAVYLDQRGEAYFRQNAVSRLEIQYIKRESKKQWIKTAEIENKHPFDLEQGPLIRFFVFYGAKSFDILTSAHHLVGDGDAIARLLRDVVMAYAGMDVSYQEQKLISGKDDFPVEAVPTVMVKVFSHYLNFLWKKGRHPRFGQTDYQEMFHNYHQFADIKLLQCTLLADEMKPLYRACREHRVTINDILVTAFMAAVSKHRHSPSAKKIIVGIPINIRSQLSFCPDRCLGNFASAITVMDHYNFKADFWKNTRRIHAKLRTKLRSVKASWVPLNLYTHMEPLLVDAMYFAAFGNCDDNAARKAAAFLAIKKSPGTAISNLGQLKFNSQIGSYQIHDLVFFAPKLPGSSVVLGAVTLGDTLQIGFSFDKNIYSDAVMEDISLAMIKMLRNHLQSNPKLS